MFLAPATPLTAAHWNDLFQAADAQLTTALGGLSAVLTGWSQSSIGQPGFVTIDTPWDRAFFFFDPLTVDLTTLHPLAQFLFTNGVYWNLRSLNQQVMFLRKYDHAAITSLIAGLATSGAPALGVQKITKTTWTAWSAVIYPSGFASFSQQNMLDSTGMYPADNMLDVSLGIIRVGGLPVTFNDATTAEHAQPLKPIDLFINANLTWSSDYDKYTVVRVHNCGRTAHAAFGVLVGPGASRCFRLIAGVWEAQGNYFHWMQSGDGRFLSLTDLSGGTASIFNPGVVADALQRALTISSTNFGAYVDPLKMWDASPVLNNPAYVATPTEKPMPAGGYFATPGTAALLGDLLVHRGQVLLYTGGTPPHVNFAFTGFATLATALSGVGVNSRALVQSGDGLVMPTTSTVTNLEIYGVTGTTHDLVDLSSPLITFLTQLPAAAPGASQTTNPPSLTLPWLVFAAVDLEPATTPTEFDYYNWMENSDGSYSRTTLASVTVNNLTPAATAKKQVFLPTDTVAAVETWIGATLAAGGILSAANFNLLSTAFGPVLQWDELWPLKAGLATMTQTTGGTGFGGPFDYLNYAGIAQVRTTKVVLDESAGAILRVTRSVFLQDTVYANYNYRNPAIFPPRDGGRNGSGAAPFSACLKWNFPRTDQQYQLARWFHHDPALAPMMPDWSSDPAFAGSHYANEKYDVEFYPWLRDGWGNPVGDALTVSQFNTVISFYETNPISVDTPTPPTTLTPKTGISRMGAWTPLADVWAPFSAWLAGAAVLTYNIAPDLVGTGVTNTINIGLAWYFNNRAAVLANSAIGYPIPNALPCQAEHFNALASLVNAQPPATALLSRTWVSIYQDGVTDGSIVFPWYNAPNFTLAPAETNVVPQYVYPRTAFYCWTPPASGPDPVAAYVTGLGATVQTSYGFGLSNGATNPTIVKWISIDDARTIYANFGIPFTLNMVAYPVSWVVDTDPSENPMGGYFKPDATGTYLQVTNGTGFAHVGAPGSSWDTSQLGQDAGILQPPYPTQVTRRSSIPATSLCVQREGLCDLCVIAVPRNYAYGDPSSVPPAALAALGDNIIPVIADNTVEASAAEATIVPGAGGVGLYDHLITTGLSMAIIQTTPIDDIIYPPIPGGL